MFFLGKYNFSDKLGSFLLACVVGPGTVAFEGYTIVFLILDTYYRLVACFGAQYLKTKQIIKLITYLQIIYESQIV